LQSSKGSPGIDLWCGSFLGKAGKEGKRGKEGERMKDKIRRSEKEKELFESQLHLKKDLSVASRPF